MAEITKSFFKVSPSAGADNAALTITSLSAHTGRVSRSATFTVKTTQTPVVTKTVTVKQSPKTEFITVDPIADVPAAGGKITITGKSNVAMIGCNLKAICSEFQVAGVAATFDTAISGDPGATAEYSFSVKVLIAVNTSARAKTYTLSFSRGAFASASAEKKVTVQIKQLAAAPTLTLDTEAPTLAAAASATATVNITSNADWTLS